MLQHNFHCSLGILFNKCRDIASNFHDKVHICRSGILPNLCCDMDFIVATNFTGWLEFMSRHIEIMS